MQEVQCNTSQHRQVTATVNKMSFSNKVAIVTGGSSGIGAVTAIHLAREGASVALVGRNEDKLEQVAAKITELGKDALILKADLANDKDVNQIVEKTVEKFDKIDILVNNAGHSILKDIGTENFIQAHDRIMNINLRSVALLTSLAVPHLKKTKGNIVNISSTAGESTMGGGNASYCASKAGLNQFSRNCAMELAEHGVRVNVVSPGPVRTNFLETMGLGHLNLEQIAKSITALKTLTEPQEVAEVIAFLASDKAKSITGSNYYIDGGYMITK